jgi:hypothetical protein
MRLSEVDGLLIRRAVQVGDSHNQREKTLFI